MNQLIRENNVYLNKSITYTYDLGGNILNKKEYAYTTGTLGTVQKTITYTYGDTNWKDKLTNYNGKAITYDAIGNPLTYDGYTYTWQKGRQLASISGNSQSLTFKYNQDGLRTKKISGSTTTEYLYSGDLLMQETNGTKTINYLYGPDGALLGLQYNGTNYYYMYNVQGDVIALYNSNGDITCRYIYDSWGKLISITDESGEDIISSTHIANVNPIRYRGYYYDVETGLYYLQSRYYNPEWGRFVNADDFEMLLEEQDHVTEHNLFIYCLNNPVNMEDSEGKVAWFIVAAAKGAAFDVGSYLIRCLVTGEKVTWSGVGKAALIGAISGITFGAAGKAIKAIRTSAKAAKAAKITKYTTGSPNVVGKIGEKLAKITKNTKKFRINGRYRIPDGVNKARRLLQEVKNVKSLSLTSQLKDSMQLAKSWGYKMELYIRPNTILSGPLKQAIKQYGVKIKYLW